MNGLEIDYNVTNATGRKIYQTSLELPTPYTAAGNGNLLFRDTGTLQKFANMYMVEVQDKSNPNLFNPVLVIDGGFWVEKDFLTYGMLATSSDPNIGHGGGAIKIGHGFQGFNDPPQIMLTAMDRLHLYQANATTYGDLRAGYAVAKYLVVNPVSSDPSPTVPGQLWVHA